MTSWSAHQVPPSGRSAFGHSRSLSSILRSASPKAQLPPPRPTSTSDSVPTTPSTPQSKRAFSQQNADDDNEMSTIPDPRSRAMSPANTDAALSPHHPDLDQEVATLSTKLINAINHQTTLDDNLSATRAELENARGRIRQLEQQVEEQREVLAGDVWVNRKTAEAEKAVLLARVAEEKKARVDMEQQKKKIEQELENLTAALFEEANKMVITAKEEARVEQDVLHRKNDQLKAQLVDTEGLLKSQQEQLAELKHVMELMSAEKEEQYSPTMPSSPGLSKFDAREEIGLSDAIQHSPSEPLSPSYPTSFTHLLQPVLRTDLASYTDFKDLIRTSKRLSGARIPPTASSPGLTSLSAGNHHVSPSNGSNSSISTTGVSPVTAPQTPITPVSSSSIGSPLPTPALPHLKETKFYKRALTEDIEPTLRFDTAPGLSWLARRSVLTAMTDGSLVVEPIPAASTGRFGRIIRPELYPCSLCGESRKDEEYLRVHRFRTSESGSAQSGYPLCKYCLTRVRATCDFLGFLRIVKDGHWRADDEDAEKAAWEESVRLREQMFWSRIGGGVVPSPHLHQSNLSISPSIRGEKSPRPSHDDGRESAEPVDVTERPAGNKVIVETKPDETTVEKQLETEESTAREIAPVPQPLNGDPADTSVPTISPPAAPVELEQQPQLTPPASSRNSTQSLGSKYSSGGDEVKRLSVTIPGSFD
ncbi:hypothetical protein B0H67DRAFT_139443 [Lasiosphaeris hirsuta]|uniref:GDP/GTP exchange factor Sec2 N-terminal domain-containing protein n=1 Tax=Lasiosphaeris hirsuta TaxID=260670 RepID=A0AA40B1C0_9PEZI|nr:hypothetical protein B0H67DRAFT_139443 [Lasiosphaeris hirsuta]